jgi:ABC-2 type transport system ATP-binding protein
MEKVVNERIQEIELALENQDLNRVSRRVLDYTFEFDLPIEIQKQSLEYRITYNTKKQLGSSGNKEEELADNFASLLKVLKVYDSSPIVNLDIPEIICEVKGIGKTYRKSKGFKLNPIDLILVRGKIIGLVGENGNGKTTLLRLISTDLAASFGEIKVFEGVNQIRSYEKIKQRFAFIPQRIERWFGSVESQISFCASIKGLSKEENKKQTQFIIHRLGLTNFYKHTWSELSSGYKLRVEIAKTLVWNPKVLILDEPLANLDLLAQELLLQDLRDLVNSHKNPVTVILSSQQLHEVETVADQIVFLKNGRAVYNGSVHEIKNTDKTTTIELDGSFNYSDLMSAVESIGIKLEQNSSGFTLICSHETTAQEILKILVFKDLKVTYFRDITNSTKKLFNDKYQ